MSYFGSGIGEDVFGNIQNNRTILVPYENTVGDGTLTDLEIYIAGGASGDVRLGVYDTDGNLLLDAGTTTVISGWTSISGLTLSVYNATIYALTFEFEDNTVDIGVNWSGESYYENLGSFTSFPSIFSYSGFYGATFAIRAYVESGVDYPVTCTVGIDLSPTIDRNFDITRATSVNLDFATNMVRAWGRTITSSIGLSLSPSLAKVLTFNRATISNLSLTSNIIRNITKIIATSSGLTLDTSISFVKGFVRILSTGVTLSASLAHSTGKTIISTVSLALSTSIVRGLALTRSSISNLSLISSIIATFVGAAAQYLITIVTNLSLVPTLSRGFNSTRSITSSLNLDTIISKIRWVVRSSTSNLSLSVSLSRALGYIRDTLSDLSLTPSIARSISRVRTITSEISLSTSISRAKGFVRSLTSNLSLAVSVSKTRGFARTITVSLSLLASIASIVRTLSQAFRRFLRAPTQTWDMDISKTNRYGVNPTTSSGTDVSESGRYGSQP
jgi:hypothetical protein